MGWYGMVCTCSGVNSVIVISARAEAAKAMREAARKGLMCMFGEEEGDAP